jgi:hypothetical protein
MLVDKETFQGRWMVEAKIDAARCAKYRKAAARDPRRAQNLLASRQGKNRPHTSCVCLLATFATNLRSWVCAMLGNVDGHFDDGGGGFCATPSVFARVMSTSCIKD